MDDLISRKAAINALAEDMPQPYTPDGSHPADEGIFMAQEIYADCIQTLKELPSAQPERKKGKWIERNPRNSPDCRLIECSECGNAYIVGYNIDYDDWIDGRNFCMKCGADMRGEQDG